VSAAALEIRPGEAAFVPVATLVLWLLVLGTGVAGVVVPYARPSIPAKKEAPIIAESLNVELTTAPLPRPAMDLPKMAEPPPLDPALIQPIETPSLTAVAEPNQVIFALPVEGPVKIVEPKKAAFVAPAAQVEPSPAAQLAPVPQQLTLGEGEGRQPAPEYPYRARREGQEGVVKVQFTVGENGQVLLAEASSPSHWPLLNQAAVRAVRERWRFRAGTLRLYEVAIRFQLSR